MLNRLKKLKAEKSEKGFTIIEVMIVLAIAGLIILIVFLAVPALNRSSHNTQRKNDAAAIQAATANYLTNNNGALPTLRGVNTVDANSLDICGAGGTVSGSGTCTGNLETAKLGFYNPINVFINPAPATAPTITAGTPASNIVVTTQSVIILTGYGCGVGTTVGTPISSPKSVAVYYDLESTTGNGSLECTD